MKYFYDTEFIEHKQKNKFSGIPIGETKPTIDLISIGIICEDGREYYAVSKDFNLKEAWNRYDLKHEQTSGDMRNQFPNGITKKVYWIRENVLMPIFFELAEREFHNVHFKDEWTYEGKIVDLEVFKSNKNWTSNFTWFKKLINKYGKTNKQIAQEVKNFCYFDKETKDGGGQFVGGSFIPNKYPNIDLYGYYSAYDHVALCWLFGKMIDLPKGFPMYTIDLKQSFDEKAESFTTKQLTDFEYGDGVMKHDVYEPLNYMKVDYTKVDLLKRHKNYPKQTNEHNALADAKWNLELYNFINKI